MVAQGRKPVKLPRWLWPRQRISETTAALRLGRVLHWAFAIAAVLLLVLAAATFASAMFETDPSMTMITIICMGAAMVAALFGRAVLYVLGSE